MVLTDTTLPPPTIVTNAAYPGVLGDTEYDCNVALPVRLAVRPKPNNAPIVAFALMADVCGN